MEQSDLLRFTVTAIEKLGLHYFVTGSTATIFYGEPRFTNDIDIVVDLPAGRVAAFCGCFPAEDFYVSEEAALAAVKSKGQFNIIHPASGFKVDVIVPEASEFNESRFIRVRRINAADNFDANFASPEDAILKKMDYYQQGGSEKHLRDITGILASGRQAIDERYIGTWSQKLGLIDIWREICARLGRNE